MSNPFCVRYFLFSPYVVPLGQLGSYSMRNPFIPPSLRRGFSCVTNDDTQDRARQLTTDFHSQDDGHELVALHIPHTVDESVYLVGSFGGLPIVPQTALVGVGLEHIGAYVRLVEP